MEKEYLTAKEAANFLGMKLSYLYKFTSKRKIPFYRPTNKHILFKKKELTEWVENSRVGLKEE